MGNNMRFYDKARHVPDEAKKPIGAGRLKGMTDVNPMFRIKMLTELFGPCGIGWWYEIVKREIVDDEITKQRAAYVDIMLYYIDPETGAASLGIPGTGGAAFVANESKGPYLSDECFKMALTDALSVACKALGIAADVYWEKDRTKYTTPDTGAETPAVGTSEAARAVGEKKLEAMESQVQEASVQACDRCGKPITGWVDAKGNRYTATALIKRSREKYNGCYCAACMTALNEKKKVS